MKVRDLLSGDEKAYVNRTDFSIKTAVQRLVNNNIYLRQKECNIAPISTQQRKEIEAYWHCLLEWHDKDLVNYGYYDVYNKVENDKSKLKYYIPDSFFYAFVDEFYTNPQRSTSLDDKNYYDFIFAKVNRPKTIARKIDDQFFDDSFNPMSAEEFIDICKAEDEIVVKASVSSYGGHGVKFFDMHKDSVERLLNFIYTNNTFGYKGNRIFQQYIVQGVVKQHPALSAINESVNTVRVITLLRNGECDALSSVLRMGINGSRVDNCSSGGIVCGIDKNGRLKNVAYDAQANQYFKHPQGYEFAGMLVPGYDKIIELAKQLAYRFYGYSKLISWDFAVGENGEPILIEMNISFGEIDFHQLCNGPIFGDKTNEILKEVKGNNYTMSKIIDYLDAPYEEAYR